MENRISWSTKYPKEPFLPFETFGVILVSRVIEGRSGYAVWSCSDTTTPTRRHNWQNGYHNFLRLRFKAGRLYIPYFPVLIFWFFFIIMSFFITFILFVFLAAVAAAIFLKLRPQDTSVLKTLASNRLRIEFVKPPPPKNTGEEHYRKLTVCIFILIIGSLFLIAILSWLTMPE